ncbi:MAG: 30S ribosomal protein S6 [Candidatus Krumholzibacteriota bacterium]|nr:30S ribosomal protein S6 [Candidatus Krumholzibacteriota bacterium]
MRTYECVYILDASLDDSTIKEKSKRFGEIIASRGGEVTGVDPWGKRKLAYPIKKRHEGTYTLLRFTGDNDILAELNRVFRFDDAVLRHMIIVDDHPRPAAAEAPATETAEE